MNNCTNCVEDGFQGMSYICSICVRNPNNKDRFVVKNMVRIVDHSSSPLGMSYEFEKEMSETEFNEFIKFDDNCDQDSIIAESRKNLDSSDTAMVDMSVEVTNEINKGEK